MRKLLAVLSTAALLAAAFPAHAEQKELLGQGNVALKLGFGAFMDEYFDVNELDHATFVEIEGYYRVAPAVYLGVNVGAMFIGEGDLAFLGSTDVDFYPFELNVKYARELSPRVVVDGGAGVSLSYAAIHVNNLFAADVDESDWLPGGQLFADLTFKFNWFTIGPYIKYQMTGDFKDRDANFNNWRGGVQFGVIF